MKTVLLIRHAKSSAAAPGLSDLDRPLNERGKEDATMIAKRMKDKKIIIEAFVSSPAKRALQTAWLFMKEYHKDKTYVIIMPSLYEASVHNFYSAISQFNDQYDTVALFSHNPGITGFINSLQCSPVYNLATAGVYAVSLPINSWKNFMEADKTLLFFDYPKSED